MCTSRRINHELVNPCKHTTRLRYDSYRLPNSGNRESRIEEGFEEDITNTLTSSILPVTPSNGESVSASVMVAESEAEPSPVTFGI